MQLMTNELWDLMPDLYSDPENANPTAYVKWFTAAGSWTWYVMEISKQDRDTCFGFVTSSLCPEGELGNFSLKEIESLTDHLGLPIERDLWFTPITYKELRKMSQ